MQNAKKYVNEARETVSKNEAVGFPATLDLEHPDFILHADKTGFNHNSREDDNVGGHLFIGSASNEKLLVESNENDCRVAVMGFTNSLGTPMLCVAIIKGSQLECFEKFGVDLEAKHVPAPEEDTDV